MAHQTNNKEQIEVIDLKSENNYPAFFLSKKLVQIICDIHTRISTDLAVHRSSDARNRVAFTLGPERVYQTIILDSDYKDLDSDSDVVKRSATSLSINYGDYYKPIPPLLRELKSGKAALFLGYYLIKLQSGLEGYLFRLPPTYVNYALTKVMSEGVSKKSIRKHMFYIPSHIDKSMNIDNYSCLISNLSCSLHHVCSDSLSHSSSCIACEETNALIRVDISFLEMMSKIDTLLQDVPFDRDEEVSCEGD